MDIHNFTNTLQEKGVIQDCIIDFPIKIQKDADLSTTGNILKFTNCIFKSDIKIEHVKNTQLTISFSNCKFENSVDINSNEKLKELTLKWHNQHNHSSFENKINIKDNQFEKFCKLKILIKRKAVV